MTTAAAPAQVGAPPPPHRRTAGDRVRAVVRTAGELLVTFGLVVLLFCVYDLYVTGLYTESQQKSLTQELTQTWDATPRTPAVAGATPAVDPGPELGDAMAILRIPAFGADWARVVVEGVGREDLKKGPGHYPGTAGPGEVGNLVISGHRTTYGAPFNRLDELREGDDLVLETRDSYYTYRVTGQEVVAPTDVDVLLPVPDQPGVRATEALLTLTTCNPKYSARERLILFAALTTTTPKAAGLDTATAG